MIQDISKEEYLKLQLQNISSLSFTGAYENADYYYLLTNGEKKVSLKILKNSDGLKPIIIKWKQMIYLGFDCCLDVITENDFSLYKHFELGSPVYELIPVQDKLILIQECDVDVFTANGERCMHAPLHDVIVSYRVYQDCIQIKTWGEEEISIPFCHHSTI